MVLTHNNIASGLDFDSGKFVVEIDGKSTTVGDMPDPNNGWYAGIDALNVCKKSLELGRPLTAQESLKVIEIWN